MKKFCFVAVTCIAVMMFVYIGMVESSEAATEPVRIWRISGDENLLNAAIRVGTNTGFGIDYKLDGITERSHTWSVADNSICTISENGNKIALTGVREGLTKLTLKVTATDGKTYQDYAYVSVFTQFGTAAGKTSKQTMARRSPHTGTYNKNERGYIPSGTSLSVIGQCGSYYRIDWNGYNFNDGVDNGLGYVSKGDIVISVQSITTSPSDMPLKKGDTGTIKATVKPDAAAGRTITWSSQDASIASVDQSGRVKGMKKGVTRITASCDGKSGSTMVSCYEEMKESGLAQVKGNIKSSTTLKTGAYDESTSVRTADVGEAVSIIGDAVNYYYVKMDSDSRYGFISKGSINVPIVSIDINGNGIEMEPNKTRQLSVTVVPSIATEKKVEWKVSDSSIASVDANGKLYTKAQGNITVSATSGRKTAKQDVRVVLSGGRTWRAEAASSSKKNGCYIIQGMTGYKNRVYYIKRNQGDTKAVLYTAKIVNGKIKKNTETKMGLIKGVKHANGMVAVEKKSLTKKKKDKDQVYLFIAPLGGKANRICRITVKGEKLIDKKPTIIKLDGKAPGASTAKFRGIAYYKSYFVLQSGKRAYVCKYDSKKNKFSYVRKFSTGEAHKDDKSKTSRQGTGCGIDNQGRYYMVYSYARKSDCEPGRYDKELKKVSYIYRYNVFNSGKAKDQYNRDKVYKIVISDKALKKYKMNKFEMEDIYIYKDRIYFGVYGGGKKYNDLFGSTKK